MHANRRRGSHIRATRPVGFVAITTYPRISLPALQLSVLGPPDGAQLQTGAGRVRVAVRRARRAAVAESARRYSQSGESGGRRGVSQFLLGRHPSRPNRKVQLLLVLDADAPVVARAWAGGVAGNRVVKTRDSS